jgi:hypothetical protein
MIDPQNLEDLENTVGSLQWESVSLEPLAEEVEALDQQLPESWQAFLDQEQAFEQEVLGPLTSMSEQELNSTLDVPEGDIDLNAQQAVEDLGLDIDSTIRDIEGQEMQLDSLEFDQGFDQSDDFGR